MATQIDQHISYVDEDDTYDDPDEVQARHFMTPLLIFLTLVFLTAVVVAVVRG